jgi:L-threonylcarbamoyladenylate synthase
MNKKELIDQAVEQLKKGKVILCPADTIWGLSCDATNDVAINKIFELKKRDKKKSFIILLNSDAMINNCIKEIPGIVWDLIDLSTEPLSIIMDGAQYVAKNAINENGSIAFRRVKSGIVNDIITKFRKPIISTSPNLSGESTPITLSQISSEIKSNVDFTVPEEFAKGMTGKSSKLIKVKTNGEVIIVRK